MILTNISEWKMRIIDGLCHNWNTKDLHCAFVLREGQTLSDVLSLLGQDTDSLGRR
jgi:hypothetical protein